MLTQTELIRRFARENAIKGKASNMFVDGDILYSYGRHFPLLVRLKWGYLQNADHYSRTTSAHQSLTASYADALVPFSALAEALYVRRSRWDYDDLLSALNGLDLVYKEKERLDILAYEHLSTDKRISPTEYGELSEDEQNMFLPIWERRPESLVLKFNERYLLSSMDNNRYFIAELPEPVATVDEAFEVLKPEKLNPGKEWVRQGEWFFQLYDIIPLDKHKSFYKSLTQKFMLPRSSDSANPHIATRGNLVGDDIVVSGQIRHSEHRTLKLSTTKAPKIFVAMHNRAIASWSADGRVD